jgi:Domain of unknown function (DUF4260)
MVFSQCTAHIACRTKRHERQFTMSGIPRYILRAEGLLVLLSATYAYSQLDMGWLFFAILFFVPDVFMIGYLRDAKLGAAIYNFGHCYIVPGVMLVLAHSLGQSTALAVSLIWIAHIGLDRVLGYELKYAAGFKVTHLSPSA